MIDIADPGNEGLRRLTRNCSRSARHTARALPKIKIVPIRLLTGLSQLTHDQKPPTKPSGYKVPSGRGEQALSLSRRPCPP